MENKDEDVSIGANKYRENQAIGTAAQSQSNNEAKAKTNKQTFFKLQLQQTQFN
jgi:hypothetical protein